jgi:hypothetical protein
MIFDPPLSRVERRLIWLWFVTSGTAAAALFLGVFWWWGLLIVTIPILIAAILAPTLWIYLTLALMVWLTFRSRPRVALSVGAGAFLLVGLAVPAAINAHLDSKVRKAAANDRGAPVQLGPNGGTVAWLMGGAADAKPYCDSDCLRFLVTGRAQAVLVGRALRGLPEAGQAYMRLRLVPWSEDRGCVWPPGIEHHLYGPHLNLILRQNLCVAMDKAPLGTARLIFTAQYSPSRFSSERVPTLGLTVRRFEAYAWRAGQPVLRYRRSEALAPKLGPLLALLPLQGADIGTPADWWRSGGDFRAGSRLGFDPKIMLADRMDVPAFDDRR